MDKPTIKIETRVLPVKGVRVRANADGAPSRTVEGVAIVFNTPSLPLYEDDTLVIREQIAPEAVTEDFLNGQDILATLYHDDDRILARSVNGSGTLSYEVCGDGVHFSFDAPDTADGDTALELVRRGDVDGCSFQFGVNIADPTAQERTVAKSETGKKEILYTVRSMVFIRDFTLTPRPVYASTAVQARMREREEALDAFPDIAERERMAADVARLRKIADI